MENEPQFRMSSMTFVEVTKKLLILIDNKHTECYKDVVTDDSEDNICSSCNGFLYVCEGGIPDADCRSCNGTGQNTERVFDVDEFIEFMEHTIMFGSQPFYELIHCEIDETVEGIETLNNQSEFDDSLPW